MDYTATGNTLITVDVFLKVIFTIITFTIIFFNNIANTVQSSYQNLN